MTAIYPNDVKKYFQEFQVFACSPDRMKFDEIPPQSGRRHYETENVATAKERPLQKPFVPLKFMSRTTIRWNEQGRTTLPQHVRQRVGLCCV